MPELSIFASTPVWEGGTVYASVSANTMSEQPFSVDYSIVPITATPTDDYYLAGAPTGTFSGTIYFAAWEMWANLDIMIVSDSIPENAESFRIELSNPVNATLSAADQAIVEIAEHNEAPMAMDIFDEYRWVEDDQELQIALSSYFSDPDHALSELNWNLTITGSAAVSNAWIDGSQVLHVDFSIGTPGQNNLKIRATDPLGKYAESDFDLWSVEVTDFDLERNTDSGWVAVDPASEVVWDEDELRWTAHILPDDPSLAVTTEWLASPWPGEYYTGGSNFAGASGLQPAIGNPGMGNHAISPRIVLPNAMAAYLAAPVQVIIASLISIEWKQHDYGDGASDFVPGGNTLGHGGDLIYAEKPYADEWSPVHDKIDVEVTIAWGGGPRPATNVFLKVFDPDHDSGDIDFDTNGTSEPNDNRATGGGIATPGASFDNATVHFDPTESVKRATLTIANRRPGNNFIVVGAGRQDRLDDVIFSTDGVTLLDTKKAVTVPEEARTKIVTVWRTLHAEEDSMGAPNYSVEAFDGAGVGNDDVDPGNLGTNGGAGDFVQPSLALLTSEFARGHVRVVTIPGVIDTQDDVDFVHNLTSSYYGDDFRDVPTQTNYWTVQVLASYEGSELLDGDDGDTEAWGGKTSLILEGPVYVFLEVLRDVNAQLPGCVDTDRLRQRTVLHETLHRFDYTAHDVAVMNPDNLWTGTDAENALVGKLLRILRDNDIR